MLKRLVFTFLALCLAACSSPPAPPPTSAAGQGDAEEQAVYAALIQAMFPADMLVLMDTTATAAEGSGGLDQTLRGVLQNMPPVSAPTVDNFKARNGAVSPLRSDMQLGLPYVLLSQAELNAIFAINQDGWGVFHGRYPQADGILTLSRAGFDDRFEQALVYAGYRRQGPGGAGYYVLLKKITGTWTIEQKVKIWNSRY
jgi:hypothetical protein